MRVNSNPVCVRQKNANNFRHSIENHLGQRASCVGSNPAIRAFFHLVTREERLCRNSVKYLLSMRRFCLDTISNPSRIEGTPFCFTGLNFDHQFLDKNNACAVENQFGKKNRPYLPKLCGYGDFKASTRFLQAFRWWVGCD